MKTGIKSIYISYAVKGDPFKIVARYKCSNAREAHNVISKCFTLYPSNRYRMTREEYVY